MLRLCVSLVFLILCGGPGFAAQLAGDTLVPFSADRTVHFKDKTYTGKLYAAPGMQRHEQEINGLHPVLLLRADRQIAYLLLPELHIYADFPFPKAVTEEGDIGKLGRPVSHGTIAGQAVDQFRVQRTGSDGSSLDGFAWLTKEGIVVKLEGTYSEADHKPTEGTLELTNIVRGPQDPALFEVPAGMKQLPPAAVAALFSLRLPKKSG
jgi:hypothetical protein